MNNGVIYYLVVLVLYSTTACGPYSIAVNEREVYRPPSLFDDFIVEDPALKTCITQAIKDNQIYAAKQLEQLSCSSAGISSVVGLEHFSGLKKLDLSDNTITQLASLYQLTELNLVYLENNQLINIEALLTLPNLADVNLQGNPLVLCSDIHQLEMRRLKSLQLPAACRD